MGFLDAIKFALFCAFMEEQEEQEENDLLDDEEEFSWMEEEEEEKDTFEELYQRLDDAERDFNEYCSTLGFSDIRYLADYRAIDWGEEFVDEEIEKMEEYRDKLYEYLSKGGDPKMLSYAEDIDDYITKLDYLDSAGLLDKQAEYMWLDYDDIVSIIAETKSDADFYSDTDEEEADEDFYLSADEEEADKDFYLDADEEEADEDFYLDEDEDEEADDFWESME